MAAAYVKEIGKNTKNTAGSTLVITASATAGSGNMLVIRGVGGGGVAVSTVTDARSNTWTIDVSHGTSPKTFIASTLQNGGAIQSGDSITVTFASSVTPAAAICDEFSGIAASRVDQTQTATATTTNRDAGTTGTLAQAAELVVAAFGSGTVETAAWTHGSGYSDFTTKFLASSTSIVMIEGEYQVVAATTAVHPTATGVTMNSNGAVVTYKATVSAPANTVAPAVTGTATVGSVLTCSTGTWTDNGSPTFTYQWQRGGVNIGSATSSTYTLVDADDATNVRCVVTDTDANGATAANSNAVAVTEPVPTNSVAPAVTGTAKVGSVLTSDTGTWTHQGGTVATYTYQWQRGGSNIGSATSSTYTLVDADDATNVRCVVTATNTGGAGTPANSNAVAITEPVPTNSVAPTVSGSTPIGSTLTATTGTWTHQGGTVATYAYQWTRDGSNIAAATSSTYVTVTADGGHAVGCKVTATNSGGAGTATASSNSITVDAAAGASTGILKIRLDDTSRVDSGIRLTLGTGN